MEATRCCFGTTAVADLEALRFDVQDSQLLSHIPDDMRNVMVARGTRKTLPLHLFAGAETPTNDAIADFARAVRTDTPPPLLVASPPTCCAYGHAPTSAGCFFAVSEISPTAEGVHY